MDCSEHERWKTCRDFVATIVFANYKLVILSLSTWCLGVDGSTHRNPVHCFLNSQALRWWRQQWLTSVLLKRLLCRVLATTIQDERKESTKGVATRPAACQGELPSTTSRPTRRKAMQDTSCFTALRRTCFAVPGAM